MTERNEESYLQNEALAQTANNTPPQETASSDSPSPAEVNIPVNITIHVDAKEGGSPMQTEENIELDEPAEQAAVDELPPPPKDATEARRTRAVTEDYRVPFSIYMEE